MKQQIATTQKQTDRLLKCGVPVESADFARYEGDSVSMMEWDWSTGSYGGTYAAWSLSALVALLPEKIEGGHWLTIQKCKAGEYAPVYYGIAYFKCKWDNPEDISNSTITTVGQLKHFTNPDLIECAVLMIEWLTANNYKLNEL